MTNETKHTPTPWVHKDGEVYEENDFKIFDAYNSDFLYEEDKANAAHIVKCVNMHDELVEALRDLLTFVVTVEYEESPIVAFAEAVLAKARGETL